MEKKKRFNYIYNSDETFMYGKGYYLIFEGHDGKPLIETFYPTWEVNEMVDGVSVGILNKIKHLTDMGYVLDVYFITDLNQLL